MMDELAATPLDADGRERQINAIYMMSPFRAHVVARHR